MSALTFLGENSQGIGVSEALFLDYPQVTQFQFSLSFEVKSGTSSAQTGFASLDAFVNKLPFGGTCSISPKYVSSAEMPFYVTCEDWRDDNGIQKYEIYGMCLFNIILLKQNIFNVTTCSK